MSYKVHIPVDDIPDSDLEADLREAAHLGESDGSPSDPDSASRAIDVTKDVDFPVPAQEESDSLAPNLVQPIVSPVSVSGGGGLSEVSGSEEKDFSDFDLAKARSAIEDSRSLLLHDGMKEKAWGNRQEEGEGDGYNVGPDRFPGNGVRGGMNNKIQSNDDISKKRTFVDSLKKEHQMDLAKAKTTNTPKTKRFQDLLSDLKKDNFNDEDGDDSGPSEEDITEDMRIRKLEKSKNIKLVEPGDDGKEEREDRPYQNNKKHGKEPTTKASNDNTYEDLTETKTSDPSEIQNFKASGGGEKVKEKTKRKRLKKKHKQHKGEKDGRMHHSKASELNNVAVAKMIEEDAKSYRNESAVFELVDKQKDRVDLPLSESDGAWTHKVHGRRDIVLAGSIVMCLGVVVILFSLLALLRRRFANSAKKRANTNNNRRYHKLGSASETEILRKPQRSLFPLASSDEEQTTESDSDDETVYHQKKVFRNF